MSPSVTLAAGLVGFTARALVDEDGRPVAEVASPLYRDESTELVACPYGDARGTQPMNRSALRQMSASWPELLGALAWLGRPAEGGGVRSVHDAWRAAVTGISLPLLADPPIPRLVSSLFKTSLGLSQVFSTMLLSADGLAEAPLDSLGTPPEFFAALDQGRWLIGAKQVCAGSRAMIVEAFGALAGHLSVTECPPVVASLGPAAAGLPPHIIALHVAHLCATQSRARLGDGTVDPTDQPPWLRAVFSEPDRPAAHALRLFPRGKAPGALEAYLERGFGVDREALDRLFSAALASL